MSTNPYPFAKLSSITARQRLENLRAKLDAAEGSLRNARDQLESETVAQGLPVAKLFGDCHFVRRSSAENWLADAQHEADRREVALLRRLAEKNDEDDEDHTGDDQYDSEPDDEPNRPPKNKKKSKRKVEEGDDTKEREEAGARFSGTGDAYQEHVRKSAAAIISAGERRRVPGDVGRFDLSKPAAREERAEEYEDGGHRDMYREQVEATAAAIVATGKRRRGES